MILRSLVILAGVVVAAGAVANAAPGLSLPSALTGSAFHTTKVSTAPDTRQQYIAHAQADMKQWQARMRAWNAAVEARGAEMNADARRDLTKSWATLQIDWKRLQASGDDAWAKARLSFDHASRKMKTSWQSIHSS